MERVNESPLWRGIILPYKPGFKWGEECSDCSGSNDQEHSFTTYECRFCIFNAVLVPVALGFLCVFTWKNPDDTACWVNSESD